MPPFPYVRAPILGIYNIPSHCWSTRRHKNQSVACSFCRQTDKFISSHHQSRIVVNGNGKQERKRMLPSIIFSHALTLLEVVEMSNHKSAPTVTDTRLYMTCGMLYSLHLH